MSNNTGPGILLYRNATIRDNTIRFNEDGIRYNNSAPLSLDVEIHWNNISGNAADGVYNYNTADVLNATHNYWGAVDGPGGNYQDPITGAIADGSGDNVTRALFDPYLSSPVGVTPTITVTGQLYESDSEPAVNDTVAAFEPGTSGEYLALNQTDENGQFTLTIPKDEPADIRYFQFQIENDTPSKTEIPFPRDSSPDIYALDRVNSSTAVDLASITLPQAYNVNVTVRNESGGAVPDARTSVIHQNPGNAATTGEFYSTTNENGTVVLNETRGPGIELADTVTIRVQPPEDDPQYLQKSYNRTLTVIENTTETFVLENRNTTVSGQLYESDGDPAANDLIVALGPDGPSDYMQTNGTGNFTLTIPKNATITLIYLQMCPENATSEIPFPRDGSPDIYTLKQLNTTTPLDIGQRTLPQAYNVNVTVIGADSGAPVSQAKINSTHHNPDYPDAKFPFFSSTNENGSLVFNETRGPGIELADNATIRVTPPEHDPRYIQQPYDQFLNVTKNTTRSFPVEENVVSLSGVIQENTTNPAANDTLVFGTEHAEHETLTNATGTFETFIAPNTTYQVNYWQGASDEPAPADNVPDYYPLRSVNVTSSRTLDTQILPEAHNLTVSVRGTDDSVVENATVYLNVERPEDGLRLDDHEGTEVGADGSLTRELAGTVNVYVKPPSESGLIGNGTQLTLDADRSITVKLPEAVESTGQILGPDDVGVPDAGIEFEGLDEQGIHTGTHTNDTGHFVGQIGTVGDYGVGFVQYPDENKALPRDGLPDVFALGVVNNSSRDLGPVSLPNPHDLTINVSDSDGNPVTTADITVAHSPNFGEHSLRTMTTSGDNGAVIVEAVGDIVLRVRPPDGSDLRANTTRVTVDEGMSIQVVLPGTTTVSGTVTDGFGENASPVRLEFHALDGSSSASTVTDETGAYTVELRGDTEYAVELSQRDLESMADFPNDGIPGIYHAGTLDVGTTSFLRDYQLPIGYDLNVTVVNESDEPVSGVEVFVEHTNGSRGVHAKGSTGPDGRFVPTTADIHGIEVNGSVQVHVDGGSDYFGANRELTVTDSTNVTLTLSPAIQRSGRVLEPDGTGGAEDLIVFQPLQDQARQTQTWTDATGNFTGKIGETGDYGVGFIQTESAESHEGTFPRDGVPDVYALGVVNNSSGDLGRVQLDRPQNLTITVTDSAGNPVPDAAVWVAHIPGFGDRHVGEGTTTGDNGTVTVEVIGDIGVHVRPPDGTDLRDNYTELTVAQADETAHITLESTPYSVTFDIVDADGTAIEGATVDLHDVGTNQTDGNGRTAFSVANGTYEYDISKDGDTYRRGEITVDGANETVHTTVVDLTFNVEDEQNTSLENAKIDLAQVAGDNHDYLTTQHTDENGTAVFTVANDTTYRYDISKENYAAEQDTVNVVRSAKTATVTLQSTPYSVTFGVADGDGTAIEGVTVDLHEVGTNQTDENGIATFTVANGTYDYEIDVNGHTAERDELTVSGMDETVDTRLVTLTFAIEDETNTSLDDVSIDLQDSGSDRTHFVGTEQTDVSGTAVFTVANNTTYDYDISKDQYVPAKATVTVGEVDTTEQLTLRDVAFTVTFTVVDEYGTPLSGANGTTVRLYGDEYDPREEWTNDTGMVQFPLAETGEYTYIVESSGKIDTKGKLQSDGPDVEKTITLQDRDPTRFRGYTLYPNGTALAGVNVSVRGYTEEMWENDTDPELLQTGFSDGSGHFNVSEIPDTLNGSAVSVYVIEMRKWDEQNDAVLEYMSETDLKYIWREAFAELGEKKYILSEAAKYNISGVGIPEFRLDDDGIAIQTNFSATNYSRALVWVNDTAQWAFINDEGNLTLLESDFSANSTVEIPVKDPAGLYYDEETQTFYTMNVTDQGVGNTAVWTLDRSGTLTGAERYNITNSTTDRYHSVAGIESHDGYFYIWGKNATTENPGVIDKYTETFQFVETVKNNFSIGHDLHVHDDQWYLVWGGSVTVFESDWELEHDWNQEDWATAIAHNGSGWYIGVNESDEIRHVHLTDQGIKRFGYHVTDVKTGKKIASREKSLPDEEGFEANTVSNVSFYGIADRAYAIDVSPRSSGMNVHRTLDGIENLKADTDATWNETTRELNLRMNLTEEVRRVSGYVDHEGERNFTNVTAVYFDLDDQGQPFYEAGYDRGRLAGQGDIYDPEAGYYNMSIPHASAYESEYLLYLTAYNKSEAQHYGALKRVTLGDGGGNIQNFNVSLEPLLGPESGLIIYEHPTEGDTITTALKKFQFVNETGAPMVPQSYGADIYLDYSEYWEETGRVVWQRDTYFGGAGHFEVPIFENATEGMYANVYAEGSSPRRVSLEDPARLQQAGAFNITMGLFDESDMVIDDGDIPDIETHLYRGDTADTPYPAASETLFATYPGKHPLDYRLKIQQTMLNILGGNISFRMTDINNDVTVHYSNVDTSRPGTPDAFFTSQAEISEAGDSLESLWKFGSNGPSMYDKVLVSMPYNESAADKHTVHIQYLYDEDMNVVWDAEQNTTDEIPDYYSEYVEDDAYRQYVNGTGVECTETNENLEDGLGYKDTEAGLLWLEIPHFSAVGVEVTGTELEYEGTASFTYSPVEPLRHEMVTFDASESTAAAGITAYEWDFDNDGSVDATGEVVTHVFTGTGVYDVTLTVTDSNDNTAESTTTVDVRNEQCFIATAAFGTPYAEEIDILRNYRDDVLLQHRTGELLVTTYYTVSPPIAEKVAATAERRLLVRELVVNPLVRVVSLGYATSTGLVLAGLLGLAAVGLGWRRRLGQQVRAVQALTARSRLLRAVIGGVLGGVAAILCLGMAVGVGVSLSTPAGVLLTWIAILFGGVSLLAIGAGLVGYPIAYLATELSSNT